MNEGNKMQPLRVKHIAVSIAEDEYIQADTFFVSEYHLYLNPDNDNPLYCAIVDHLHSTIKLYTAGGAVVSQTHDNSHGNPDNIDLHDSNSIQDYITGEIRKHGV